MDVKDTLFKVEDKNPFPPPAEQRFTVQTFPGLPVGTQQPDHQPRPPHSRITAHVTAGWPRLGEPLVRHAGQYCYVAALLPGHRDPTPILRLRYQGSEDRWAIAIYKASTGQYSESELPGSFGLATGTPEQG